MCQKIDIDWVEQSIYSEGYRKGFEDGRRSIGTKLIKYYDEDENVWKVGEVIVDE
jgi:hypothetical protein